MSSGGMLRNAGGILVKIGGDSSGLKKAGSDAEQALSGINNIARIAAAGLAVAITAITGAATVLKVLTRRSMENIDAQSKLAARTGSTVSSIQALERAGNLAGVSADTVSSALDRMNQRLGEVANTASGPTHDALKALGLEIESFSKLDADERLATLADRMDELGLSTSQQAAVLRDFGIRSAEMVNLLAGGGDAIRSARDEIEEFGIAVSDIDAIKIEQANDAMTVTGMVAEGIGNTMAVKLAPIIEGVADLFYDAATEANNFGDVADRGIELVVGAVGVLADQIVHTQRDFLEMQRVGLSVSAAISGAWATLAENVAGVMDAIREGWNEIAMFFGQEGMVNNNSYASWAQSLREESDGVEASLAGVRAQIQDIDDAPMPSEQIQQWLQDVRDRAEETAQATKEARDRMRETINLEWMDDEDDEDGGGGGGKKGSRGADKIADEMERQLEALREGLMSAEEAEIDSHEKRLEAIEKFWESRLITEQEYHSLIERATEEHEAKLAEIRRRAMEMEQQRYSQMAGYVTGTLQSISSIMDSEGDRQIGIQKAISLAIAGINVAEGISKALTLPFPMNLMAAAQVAAQGAAAIASINSASRGRAGTPSISAPQGGQAAGAGPMPQTMVIRGFDRSQFFSGEQVEDLAKSLIDFQKNGGQVVWDEQ